MASRKIEADVVIKVTGDEDIKAVAEDVKALADQTTNVRVEVDGEEQVARLREEFKDLDNVTVTATAKVANQNNFETFMKNVRSLDGETATAVLSVRDAQAQAALKNVVTTIADVNSTQIEVDVATGKVPALTAEIEAVEAEIKRLNETPVEVPTQPAEEGLRRVGESAGQAGQVVSNAMGNATQDIAAMAGVSGTAGQALGQLAEGFLETASGAGGMSAALAGVAAAAGPIALIAAAMQTVNGVMALNEERAAAAAARTKLLGDAMKGAADDAQGLTDALSESLDDLSSFDATNLMPGLIGTLNDIGSAIPILGALAQSVDVDIPAAFRKAGASIYDFSQAVTGTTAEGQAFLDRMFALQRAGKITGDEYLAIAQAVDTYRKSAADAAADQDLFTVSTTQLNNLMKAAQDPLSQYSDKWRQIKDDMADGTVNFQSTTDAVNFLSDALGKTPEEIRAIAQAGLDDELKASQEAAENLAEGMGAVNEAFDGTEEAVAALGRAFDQFNADSDLNFSEMAVNTVESFDSIKEALADVQDIGSKPLVPTTVEDLRGLSDESAKVVGAIGGMRDAIQTELGAALAEAGGNFDGLRDKASFFRDEVTTQFTDAFTEMGLGPAEVEAKVTELLGSLGLLPSQVETVIKISQEQEAMRKIELFGSALESLPPETLAKVTAAVDANDPVTAWNLISSTLQGLGPNEVPVNTVPGTDTATPAIEGIVNTPWGTVVAVGGDNKEGLASVQGVDTEAKATKPIIDIGANTAAAIVTMYLINGIAKAMAPVVTIGANTFPALGAAAAAMQVISGMTATPSVNAVLRDYPTASEIAGRIGVVRVPVDAYLRSEPRITGGRP